MHVVLRPAPGAHQGVVGERARLAGAAHSLNRALIVHRWLVDHIGGALSERWHLVLSLGRQDGGPRELSHLVVG